MLSPSHSELAGPCMGLVFIISIMAAVSTCVFVFWIIFCFFFFVVCNLFF